MKPKRLLLASSIALAMSTAPIGHTSIEMSEEQKWLKQHIPTDKSKEPVVAYYCR